MTDPTSSPLQLVWVQNLMGFIKGEFPADERWKSIFLEQLAALGTQPVPVAVKGLTLSELQRAHIERQEEWCPEQKPDLSFRGNEMAGEVGEACNVIKKLERERHGWRGSRATKEQLAEELADVIHTAVLCAITADIDIEAATVAKFVATSEKNGLATRIRSALAPATQAVPGDMVEKAARAIYDLMEHSDGYGRKSPYESGGYYAKLARKYAQVALAGQVSLPASGRTE